MALLGVDVGGTFTDFYLVADDGSVRVYKRPSTPGEPARAILDGLAEMGVAPDEVVPGSTVATNAIIERKGARTGLITTRGFRDTLLIGRQTRPRLARATSRLRRTAARSGRARRSPRRGVACARPGGGRGAARPGAGCGRRLR